MKMNKIALAGLATAAPSFAPSAAVDVPGLSPFVGSWHAHEEGLDLPPEWQRSRDVCRHIDLSRCTGGWLRQDRHRGLHADVGIRRYRYRCHHRCLESKRFHRRPVRIKLVGGGQGLQLWMAGGDQGFPFCNSNDNLDASHYYCGA